MCRTPPRDWDHLSLAEVDELQRLRLECWPKGKPGMPHLRGVKMARFEELLARREGLPHLPRREGKPGLFAGERPR